MQCRKRGFARTMREWVEVDRLRMDQSLFNHAQRSSQIAKVLAGKQKRVAYELKARCLRQIFSKSSPTVQVDQVRSPGLLSVGLDGCGRIHTHENWLFPDNPWRRAAS